MGRLKIGWASRDVSTDKPVNIPGQFYIRVSQGVLDPLTVTALVIDNGSDLVIFLSADLVVIRSLKKAEEGSHYSAYVSSGRTGHEGGELLVRKTVATIQKLWSEADDQRK